MPVWVRDIEPSDGDGLDFVGLLRDDSLDGLLVLLVENGGHFLSRVRRIEARFGRGQCQLKKGTCDVLFGVGVRLPWVIDGPKPYRIRLRRVAFKEPYACRGSAAPALVEPKLRAIDGCQDCTGWLEEEHAV